MPPACTITELAGLDGPLRGDYRRLRVLLWPECREEECEREVAEILARPDLWGVFVAGANEQPAIGFLEVHLRDYAEGATDSPVAYVEGWFVQAEVRRQGIGTALMQAAERWALERGCRELASDAQLTNELSIAAHLRLGFKETERLVTFLKRLPAEPLH